MSDVSKNAGIVVGQVFAASANFAHRADAMSLAPGTPVDVGEVTVQLEVAVSSDNKAAILKLGARTRSEAPAPLYQIAAEMVALTTVPEGQDALPSAEFMQRFAVSLLYPFLRELVANLTMRGRFGPVWLQPIDARKFLGSQPDKVMSATSKSGHPASRRRLKRLPARRRPTENQ